MKKFSSISLLAVTLLGLATLGHAQDDKVITLKDGSVLQGKVLQLKDNIYTLETTGLGQVDIPESDVLSISPSPAVSAAHPPAEEDGQKEQMKDQINKVQGTILADEELMAEIQDIVNDEEVKALLADPKLLEDVMSLDQDKLRQNENVQKLINNPAMQQLMQKIADKMPAQ